MSLLTSADIKEQEKEIVKTFAIKLKLEDNMSSELRKLFKNMSQAFADVYKIDRSTINFSMFEIDLIATLRKWYRKTADIFSKNIREGLKCSSNMLEYKSNLENTKEEQEDINAQIAASLLVFIDSQSKKQAQMIIETSNKKIMQDVREATKKLIEDGKNPTNAAVAEAARKEFNKESVSRSELIALQEVGLMASESKEKEANVLNQSNAVIGGIAVASRIKKNWNAMLDTKTRTTHAAADFTYKTMPIDIAQRFIVAGEGLRYPRDPNGSAGNIINCRCESLYIVV